MQYNIHPAYQEIKVTCSCGYSFHVRSAMSDDLQIEVCSKCHPFYTGQQKVVDTGGRIERFKARYSSRNGTLESQKDNKKK